MNIFLRILIFFTLAQSAAIFGAQEKSSVAVNNKLTPEKQAVVDAINAKDVQKVNDALVALQEPPTFAIDAIGTTPLMQTVELGNVAVFNAIFEALKKTLRPQEFQEHLFMQTILRDTVLDVAARAYSKPQSTNTKNNLVKIMQQLIEYGAGVSKNAELIKNVHNAVIEDLTLEAIRLTQAVMDDDIKDVAAQLKTLQYKVYPFLMAGNGQNGYTALMYAAENGNVKMVNLIVDYIEENLSESKKEEYLNILDNDEQTALVLAAKKHRKLNNRNDSSGRKRNNLREIIQILRDSGVKVDDEEMQTYAVFGGYSPEVAQLRMSSKTTVEEEALQASQKEKQANPITKKRTPEQKAKMRSNIEFTPDTKPDIGTCPKDYTNAQNAKLTEQIL